MKKQLLAIAVLTAGISKAQIWSENFTSATPPGLVSGWLQNNVDGRTVAASATFSFGTNAWVSRDYSAATDPSYAAHGKVMVSTSWYTPAGAANDWLITPSFTVPVNGVLSWDAIAPDASFPDGYLVKISTTGTTTTSFGTTLLTVAAENSAAWNSRSLSLNTYSNQVVRIAFVNNSNDMNVLLVDNISVIVPSPTDIKITAANPTGQASWGSVGSTKSITGTITNNGYNTITTYTAKYSDGVTSANTVFTGLSLAYGQTHNFTISTPYTIATADEKSIKVWADLAGDPTHTNDTLKATAKGYSFLPNHKVAFEEGTGTWCGWCPRGTVYMDSMHHVNPTTTALIAVHNGDPMVSATYDSGIGTLISGYPSALCDRAKDIIDPSDMFDAYANHIGDFGLADLTVTPTYNSTTRVASIVVNTRIATNMVNNTATNDYRLAVVFTEDGVTGTTSSYNQANYYSGGASGTMVGAGHHFGSEPNPVLAANMRYDFVARTILGGFTGQASSLPSTLVAGTSYTSTPFLYTVPATYNASKMTVHALLIDSKTNVIYNVNSVSLGAPVGVKEVENNLSNVDLYPNPTVNETSVKINSTEQSEVSISVVNTVGQVVFQSTANLNIGANSFNLDTRNFAAGIYNVVITSKNGSITKKLSVTK